MGIKEQLQSFIVPNPAIPMRRGETCFFYARGQYGKPHVETTTKVKPGLGVGVVVPVTKHIGVGVGKQKVKTTTSSKTVWNKEPCEFYVCNERMTVKLKSGLYDIDLDRVTNLKVNKDALTITCGGNDYVFFMAERDISRFMNLFNLIVQAQQSGLSMQDITGNSFSPAMSAPYSDTPASPPNRVSLDYMKTIFLWSVGRKPTPIKKRDDYPRYLFYECNIQNAPQFHREMVAQGYLQAPSAADALSTLKVTALKEILQENGLPATGKKADLIQAIVANVPNEKLAVLNKQNTYVLSAFGKQYLEAHDDYVRLHIHSGWDISKAEYDAEKAAVPAASFGDICWRIFNRRVTQVKEFDDCRNLYYDMYELMKEDGKNDAALSMLLRVLYVDLSGISNTHVKCYRQRLLSKQELYNRIETDQLIAPAVVKQIGDLEASFSDTMLTNLFQWQLPFNLCPYNLFADIVHAIINGTYDEAAYRHALAVEYYNRL